MNPKLIAVLLAVLGSLSVLYTKGNSEPQLSEFQLWKRDYSIKFDSMFEEAYRERIFMENLAKINLHNINEHKSYEVGVNQFTALTQEEFVQHYLGLIVPSDV
jgi:hypothetical protein